jgi:hypothetical protein
MPIIIPLICLVAMGVAVFQRSVPVSGAEPAVGGDVPALLLRWAAGLLSAQRAEWGQAMLGELDHIDGWGRRWRFAAGCAGAALLLPPWGRAAAAVWGMVTLAAGAAGLYAALAVRYGLGAWSWVFAAVVLVLLAGCTLAACVLVRQPGIAVPGLLGGLLVALAWLVPYGFTFYGLIVAVPPFWAVLMQVLVVPLLAGAAGTLWGGSAAAGRRIARLAAVSAGLVLFLYGTLAVAAIGAAGAQIDATWTVSANVDDRLGNNAIFYLWLVPLTTAALGWAAATATAAASARLRPRLAVSVASVPFPAPGYLAEGDQRPEQMPPYEAGRADRGRSWRRTAYLLLLGAVVAAAMFGVALGLLRG